jgi:hypothetical protein
VESVEAGVETLTESVMEGYPCNFSLVMNDTVAGCPLVGNRLFIAHLDTLPSWVTQASQLSQLSQVSQSPQA